MNAIARGANHGWPCFEGPAPQPGYQPLPGCQALHAQGAGAVTGPLATYPHATGTASITGAAFYPGTAWPELYRDAYFFGDFSLGSLHYVSIDGADAVAGPIKGFGSGIDGVVDVQADADGVLYLSGTTGELRRVRYVPDTGPLQTIYLSDATSMVTSATNGGGFTGSATDAEDGAIAPSALRWTVSVRHCPGGVCHTPHPLIAATGGAGTVTAPEQGAESALIVTLTVTDSGGRSAAVSRDLRPRVVTGTTTLPEAPVGVAAAVAGSTVTLSWGQPTTGGLPADYAIGATTDGESFGVVARSTTRGFTASSVPSGT